MKTLIAMLLMLVATGLSAAEKPWKNGRLIVKGKYLVHENGKSFFWLGNTAWLLPERLNRDEVEFFLTREAEEGYNVEQIQVLDSNYPTFNVFGQQAFDDSFDFEKYTGNGYGYWVAKRFSVFAPHSSSQSTDVWPSTNPSTSTRSRRFIC